MNNRPEISVIIPVFNSAIYLNKIIPSLLKQDYPKEKFEIICVDNNSTDKSLDLLRQYPELSVVEEREIQSSYAARNTGLKNSKASIIAFIDADCIASKQWLRNGIEKMREENADLVGGNVEFILTKTSSASEYYDSLVNMQNELNIREKKVAKTANLFVKKSIFEMIGFFPDNLQSGGDVQWTKMATDNNFKLVYAQKAIVYHPARKTKELVQKQFRVGKGQIPVWKQSEMSKTEIVKKILLSLLPTHLSKLKKNIAKKDNSLMSKKLFSIWLMAWIAKLATNAGRISFFLFPGKR